MQDNEAASASHNVSICETSISSRILNLEKFISEHEFSAENYYYYYLWDIYNASMY